MNAAYNLAQQIYLFSQPDSAFFYATYQLENARKLGLKKSVSSSYQVFGIVYFIKGKLDASMSSFDEGLRLSIANKDSENIALFYSSKANVNYQLGNFNEAEKWHKMSLIIRKKTNDVKGVASTLGNLGLIASDRGDIMQALLLAQQALESFLKTDDKRGIANAYGNLAILYNSIGNHERSLEANRHSLEIRKSINEIFGLSNSYTSLGNTFKNLRRLDSSLYYYRLALEVNVGLNNINGLAIVYSNMGNVYQTLRKHDSAFYFYKESLRFYEETKNKAGLSYGYANLASGYVNLKDYANAIQCAEKAIRLSEETGNMLSLEGAYNVLYNVNKLNKNFDAALKYYKKLIQITDSTNLINKKDEFTRKSLQFEYGMRLAADSVKKGEILKVKNAEIERQKQNLELEKITRVVLFGGILIVIVFLVLVIHRLLVARKQKRIIEEQKLKLESAFEQLNESNKELLDSIHYAQRIQRSLLPTEKSILKILKQLF